MRRELFSVFLFVTCLATTAAATPQSKMVASFGGECEGTRFQPSPQLASLIRRVKQHQPNPCDGNLCDGVFAYDLNGDGRQEYFVRLACGATGNCKWAVFSDRRARLRGTFTAWFFYIHPRTGSWSPLTAYIREGGDQGVIVALRSRHGAYVQTSERTEHGYDGNYQPFLKRMGVPKCS